METGLLFRLLLSCQFLVHAHATESIYKRLSEHIKEQSYPDVIPQTSLGVPMNVSLSLSLMNIRDVDTNTNDVLLDAWVFLQWQTDLTWDPEDFNGVSNVRLPPSSVWRPDIEVFNGQLTFQQEAFANNVIVSQDGSIMWVPKVTIRATCNLVSHLIFFNTTCSIKMGSWTHGGKELTLEDNPRFKIDEYLLHESKFEPLNVTATKNSMFYSCCPEEPYEDINFVFSFKKKVRF